MKRTIRRIKQFYVRLSKKQRITLIAVSVLLVALLAAFVLGAFSSDKEPEPEVPPEPVYSQLMGIEVDPEVAERPILGIMIENSTFARPQTGLDDAGIVFETIAEGGITRYLALFQEKMPKELGPIRSVRAYYLDWAMGFDASIAHVGGSADALALIDSRNAKTLSQFKYPEPYYRVNSREAPHNMYATTDALRNLQDELGHKTSEFDEIPRSSDSPAQTPAAPRISVNFSGPEFAVEFRYQKETNSYVRYLAGEPDVDAATKKPITVKNFIVIKLESRNIRATGSGEALVFKDGNVQTVRWKLSSHKDRIKFTDAQGKEVPLNRGGTWISAIPTTSSVDY